MQYKLLSPYDRLKLRYFKQLHPEASVDMRPMKEELLFGERTELSAEEKVLVKRYTDKSWR